MQSRLIASVLCFGPRKAAHSCSFSPSGACGTLDGSPRPRRHVLPNAAHGSVHPEQVDGGVCPRGSHDPAGRITAGSPKTQETACVPHADGLCGLLHVPGRAATAPLSRSCELSPGHALGPSARLPGLPLRLESARTGTLRPPQPAPRNDQTLATCPLPERDGRTIF